MDVDRTEALINRMKRDGWEITPNAYRYDFPGLYVAVNAGQQGSVYVSKSAPQINLDMARRMVEYLGQVDGIEDVVMGEQKRNGDILIEFRTPGFRGSWAG